jgi:SAM-dependent methyltransferase
MASEGNGPLFEAISNQFRSQRDRLLKDLIKERRSSVSGVLSIIDMGGSYKYWERIGLDFLEKNNINVTCVNYLESEFRLSGNKAERIKFIVADATNLTSFADNAFDLVHSNSVIEHVGRWNQMRAFAKEARRLAPAYYIQTPYFWFPIDPHFYRLPFYHWMPESLRLKIIRRIKVGWTLAIPDIHEAMTAVESAVILDATQFRSLFPDAEISFERFAFLPKSLIAIRR